MDAEAERTRIFIVGDAVRAGMRRRWIDRAEHERPFYGVRILPDPESSTDDSEALSPNEKVRAGIVRAAVQYQATMNFRGCFSHTTAAVLWGLPLPGPLGTEVHVSTPGRGPRAAGLVGHQVRSDLVRVVTHPVYGVAVSDPASTWAMLGGMLSTYDLVAVGDAVVRVPRIAGPFGRVLRPALGSVEDLGHALHAGRRRGADPLRVALDRIRSGAASRPETWARLVLVDAGLPEPVTDHDVYSVQGIFIGCVDLAYPELRIAIEYEGDQHRTDPKQWQRDIEKHEALADAGWRVIRVPRDQLFRAPEQYVGRVRTALRGRR